MPITALPDLPEPVADARVSRLADELERLEPHLVLVRGPQEIARLSQDCHDYSPVLRRLLLGRVGQLAVKAFTVEQVMVVAAACARHRVPLTVRGAGTGNYGQCVPLCGGVVLDLTGLKRLLKVDPASGVVSAEAGVLLAELDQWLASHGRALRLVPSTYRSATLGGFLAGGSGGIGSVRWGFLRDPGHLLGLEIVTMEMEPRRLRLDASASIPLNHAYGTNGIITSLTLATTELVNWQQVVVGFNSWDFALAAMAALTGTALVLNAVCLLEAPVAARMPWPSDCPLPGEGEQRLLLLVAPDALPVLPTWLEARGGTLRWLGAQGHTRGVPLRELCWNHTTLHWRVHHPDWTYLQMLLPQPEGPLLEQVRHRFGDAVLWHLEAVRQNGMARIAALPLVRAGDTAAITELVTFCQSLGAVIFDPHTISVEDGGLGVIDADQVAAKACHDPAGLLNPGKLRGWHQR